ncbi:hypothetical protein [Chromobacterium paludis]|uniref:Uncharacterized protein n=1 Tax=Chromobacterium paludis TaxID=2605945 RepID=A0A5C1DFF0_9NEIS|nr:hypothetical protein [Chromobacterium paludis]QEL55490.1 hypothetical protein FYK34_07890 [Chromobacterium paludis]
MSNRAQQSSMKKEARTTAEDELGNSVTDLLVGAAGKVAEAAGAVDAESAQVTIDSIDQSLARRKDLQGKR